MPCMKLHYSLVDAYLSCAFARARSTAISKSRLKKMTARSVAVDKAIAAAGEQLAKTAKNAAQYKALLVDLVTEVTVS